jgi:hypothetical protein
MRFSWAGGACAIDRRSTAWSFDLGCVSGTRIGPKWSCPPLCPTAAGLKECLSEGDWRSRRTLSAAFSISYEPHKARRISSGESRSCRCPALSSMSYLPAIRGTSRARPVKRRSETYCREPDISGGHLRHLRYAPCISVSGQKNHVTAGCACGRSSCRPGVRAAHGRGGPGSSSRSRSAGSWGSAVAPAELDGGRAVVVPLRRDVVGRIGVVGVLLV